MRLFPPLTSFMHRFIVSGHFQEFLEVSDILEKKIEIPIKRIQEGGHLEIMT